MRARHPLSDLPLPGLHFIEASAGTGKTTALTLLFLRALLEGTPIERILVVTYTEAAAEEVRGRIHDLLVAARHRALGDPVAERWGFFLEDVRPEHEGVLSQALFDIDRSTMTTIHAFCRRLLREHAFEFQAPFSLELEEDSVRATIGACQEIWRRRVYAEVPDVAALLAAVFPNGPSDLIELSKVFTLFREAVETSGLEDPPENGFDRMRVDFLRDLAACRKIGSDWILAIIPNLIEYHRTDPQKRSKKSSKPAEAPESQVLPLIARLREIVSGGRDPLPGFGDQDADLLAAMEALPEDRRAHFSPLLRLIGGTARLIASVRSQLRSDLLEYLRTEALSERERRGVEIFDDMILRVLLGLINDHAGVLSRRLRERFPVAFIDEFQDTDLAQITIFDRIYRLSEGLPVEGGSRSAVFLVGDPKQSIYRFRGADITAYLSARQKALSVDAGALLRLSVNFRSDERNVEAINHLFSQTDDPFRTQGTIGYDEVRPHHTGPSRLKDPSAETSGEPVPILFHAGEPGETLEAFALRGAREIHRLINGPATLNDHPIRPEAIAVLVRSHDHGRRMQEALGSLGIPSVSYGSGSVLETDEAFDLEMLLLALAAPDNRRQVRLVLASRFFGLTARDLSLLEDSQDQMNRRTDAFFRAALSWTRLGAMGTLRALFLEQDIFSRLLAMRGGRRRVAHLLHLFELIDEMGRDRPPLLLHVDRYLAARQETPGKKEDKNAPRLDSLEGRVRILTLHKAKGLEFPVVVLPFGLPHRSEQAEEWEEDGPAGESEEMRLLYVALTRSIHRTVLLIPSQTSAQAALSHLFDLSLTGQKGKKHQEAFAQKIAAMVEGFPLLFAHLPDWMPDLSLGAPELPAPLIAPPDPPDIPKALRTESFSSLIRRREEESPPEVREPLPGGAGIGLPNGEAQGPPEGGDSVPAGPLFGSYFHRVMERLAVLEKASHLSEGEIPQELLVEALADLDLSQDPACRSWPEAIRPLVDRTLSHRIPVAEGYSPSMAEIFRGDRAVERDFMLPVRGLTSDALSALLLPEGPRLIFDPVSGSLKGFIDLIFRVQGRTFLLDYKTNRLDASGADDPYSRQALQTVMGEHRYDLQGLIYTLALHRLLSFMDRRYDYNRDFGGAIFLFVRGLGADGRGVFVNRPSLATLLAFDRLLKGERP